MPILKVVIVGAGLGGLSAAIACALAGHSVVVLERTPELAEIGAGLQLGPNCTRILYHYGLQDQLQACSSEPELFEVRRFSDGEVLYADDAWSQQLRRKYQAPFLDVHRGQLQLMLYRRAIMLGVEVNLGRTVQTIDPVAAEIRLESGQVVGADLIVGADGLASVCRSALLGCLSPPRSTGDLAYRIVLSVDLVQDAKIREMITTAACRVWPGPSSHVVAYSLKAGKEYNIVLLVPDDLPPEVLKQPGDLDEMKALFRHWDPVLITLLSHVDKVDKWKLMHLEELQTWRNSKGNFILLGDSCHPMLPYLAQGSSMAIEDGAALGEVLKNVQSPTDLPKATEVWEAIRKNRSEFIVRESAAQGRSWHLPLGPEQELRDALLRKGNEFGPFEGFPSRWADPVTQSTLYSYDAFAAATKALAGTV